MIKMLTGLVVKVLHRALLRQLQVHEFGRYFDTVLRNKHIGYEYVSLALVFIDNGAIPLQALTRTADLYKL